MSDRIRSVLDTKGRTVYTITSTTPLLEAVAMMNERRIGAVVVVDSAVIVGILTERDVLVRVVAAGLDPRTTPVIRVMTRDPITITAAATVTEAMTVMTERRCRHLPVIDGTQLRGLVSIGDLTSWTVNEQQRRIADLHDFIRAA